MKKDIHPKYFEKAEVTCACGNSFIIGSTTEKLRVEICSACHPFYTGNEKVMDTAGMVEKFKGRMAKSKIVKTKKTTQTSKKV
ncbi:MAG: 50S ribosomal protein L31 [Candidatus Paceibacterota bacterium]